MCLFFFSSANEGNRHPNLKFSLHFTAGSIQKQRGAARDELYRQTLFTDEDFKTMFQLLDPVDSGELSSAQVRQALRNLGVADDAVPVLDGVTFDVTEFASMAKAGLGAMLSPASSS